MRMTRDVLRLLVASTFIVGSILLTSAAVAVEPDADPIKEFVREQAESLPDSPPETDGGDGVAQEGEQAADEALPPEESNPGEGLEDSAPAGDPGQAPSSPSPPNGFPEPRAPELPPPGTPSEPGPSPVDGFANTWMIEDASTPANPAPRSDAANCGDPSANPAGMIPSLPTDLVRNAPSSPSDECSQPAAGLETARSPASPRAQISSVRYTAHPLVDEVAALGAALLLTYMVWVGFSRLAPDDVLAHPRRSQILDLVRNNPGLTTHAAAQTLGLRWSVLVYHLGQLKRTHHVTIARVGGRTALFPANAGYRGKEQHVALLRRDTLRRVHELLSTRPGLDQSSIATDLQVSQALVSRSLQRLGTVGLVRQERRSRKNYYFSVAVNA